MENEKEYPCKFEEVINNYIGKTSGIPSTSYTCAGDYGDNSITKALLYSVCIMERYFNNKKYSENEKNKISFYADKILNENLSIINQCIDFFYHKIIHK